MFCWLRARKILAPCCVSHAFPACLLLGFCAIKAPEVELERLDEWPAEDLNNTFMLMISYSLFFLMRFPVGGSKHWSVLWPNLFS